MFFVLVFNLIGQTTIDTIKLPFAIAKEKELPEDDLKNKKEGTYVTGIPDISSDPVNGFGYGGEGSIYFNGKRSDPLFKYTPYRKKLDIAIFNTTKDQREILVRLDVPYIFNTKWRLRAEAGYEINPNQLYFGQDEKSLRGLSYINTIGTVNNNVRYNDYQKNFLVGTNTFYNTYRKEEVICNISAERSYFEGKIRLFVGYEFAHFNVSAFAGNSLLQTDFNSDKILGIGKGIVSGLRLGFVYDTRDLETDPSNGTYIEFDNEYSSKYTGATYNFNKTFVHFDYYKKLLPSKMKKLIFAGRYALAYTAGNAPFFEYQENTTGEGEIYGLGGSKTLRGYKQARFSGRVMNFTNFELRWRFVETKILKQHLAFSAVPFFDIGGVWDNFHNFFTKNNYRYAEGLGFRIAWNVNTILRFDYAISQEDNQFFFSFGHTF